ncbi:MAG: N-acetylmuramoyl-L-alanine amidase family protein, partial [Gemmatimonadota bacterium]
AAPEGDAVAAVRLDTLRLALLATDTATAGDTLETELTLVLGALDPGARLEVALHEAPDTVNGPSGVVVGRPTPFGPYRWRFPEGTRVPVTGRLGDRLRIRLIEDLEAWVLEEDARWVRASAPGPARAFDARLEMRDDRLSLRLGLDRAVPVHVRQTGRRQLTLLVYGAEGETSRMAYGPEDPLVEQIEWDQLPGPLLRLTLDLTEPVWGWQTSYEDGAARTYEGPRGADGAGTGGRVLRLDVHRPPPIDPEQPLAGRWIAVDPGHPPAGSTGPTGYYEGEANLAIARRLVRQLEEAGARAILVRRDDEPVGLYERTGRAVADGAELFVSIHNNALPDGIRPFGREGTSTYYHHPHARDLARAVQHGLLEELGLPDLGILWGDLAVARLSWIPSVLVEGAFMMHPAHEAALRMPEFQERYARGVLRGIEAFLRGRAAADGG